MFSKFKFKEVGTVNLVHDTDLEGVLIRINKLDDIKQGKVKCKFTGIIITFENLHALFYESGDVKFVSNSVKGIKEFSRYLNEVNS